MARGRTSLARSTSGSAGVEMALVTPLLMIMLFGAFELGNYFYSEHVVVKAVRDGARYASRRSFSEYSCTAASSDVIAKTRSITRTRNVTTGGTGRLRGWTSDTTITVSVDCVSTGTYVNQGIYTNLGTGYSSLTGGVPRVTVAASVPYASLFQTLGLSNGSSLSLKAQSQLSVMGI